MTNPEGRMLESLFAKPRLQLDALAEFKLALKLDTKAKPLNDILTSLSAHDRSSLQLKAKMLLMTASTNSSYRTQIEEMYPQMSADKVRLLVEILQEMQPIDVDDYVSPAVTQKQYVSSALNKIEADLKATAVPGKPAQQPLAKPIEDVLSHVVATPNATEQLLFIDKLIQSESSGDTEVEITIADGRTFSGALQFGAARLADYKQSTGKRFTQEQFKADTVLQDEVAQWHIKDIDVAIDALGDTAKGFDRDGLRSVAHLGGLGGMAQYVKSGGEYNPSDELGTSLSDYYNKFSS